MLVESFSDNEDYEDEAPPNKENNTNINNCSDSSSSVADLAINVSDMQLNSSNENSIEIKKLLKQKDELTRRHQMQERNNQRLQVRFFFCLYFIKS